MRKKAFTLLELLVVISIIACLIAILIPALRIARQQCEGVMCLSNLRQMFIASQVYINNNNGYYPLAYSYEFVGSVRISYAWDFTTIENLGTFPSQIKVIPGLLWGGATIEKIQQCPSFKGYSHTIADPYTGYNYNTSYIGHGKFETIATPARVDKVKRPNECALFGDGQWSGGANKFMRSPWRSEGDTFMNREAGTQGFRHRKKTNIVWCDGHAASKKEVFTQSYNFVQNRIERYNKINRDNLIGFLSPDNSAYDLD
jgi:prepilin-type N-terminal cleavage/methylation domain-containing protein/prepilin-type processing-associated H-X9-DG protein